MPASDFLALGGLSCFPENLVLVGNILRAGSLSLIEGIIWSLGGTMKTVLIADDDPITVKKITDSLAPRDYDVFSARDGEECLKMAREHDLDIIFLDVIMPVMDGLEALRELRKTSDVPVVIMSAYGNVEKVEEARQLGIECFLSKPFDSEILIDLLDVMFP